MVFIKNILTTCPKKLLKKLISHGVKSCLGLKNGKKIEKGQI